jgi:hypothetical protein
VGTSGEAFWRAHHEAWKRSDLNQRQYCEAEGIPLEAFGNWRAMFKAETLQRLVRALAAERLDDDQLQLGLEDPTPILPASKPAFHFPKPRLIHPRAKTSGRDCLCT